MRGYAVIGAVLLLAGCGSQPHEYPPEAKAAFNVHCPESNPECVCTWDSITRALTAEEYQTAIADFEARGVMDTRITRARTKCREKHAAQ